VAAEFTVVGIATAETTVGDAVVAFAAVIFTHYNCYAGLELDNVAQCSQPDCGSSTILD
jgi:hypothetical protein